MAVCEKCNGTGKCPHCNGTGKRPTGSIAPGTVITPTQVDCYECKPPERICPTCEGSGQICTENATV